MPQTRMPRGAAIAYATYPLISTCAKLYTTITGFGIATALRLLMASKTSHTPRT